MNGQPATVVRTRKSRQAIVVKLDLVSDRNHAESLRGAFLTIPPADLEPLPKGSYYHFEVIDSDVWTETGDYLGRVKEILQTGANDVYLVRQDDQEILLPAVADVVREVSPQRGQTRRAAPRGLGVNGGIQPRRRR